MKTIKIILGVIIALSLVFLGTGLFIKETIYTTQVTINKPVDEVFKKFEDTTLLKEWIPELQSFDVLEEKAGKIGSSYKMVVENQGQTITMIEKILAYVPNEKVTFHFDAENMLKTDDYVFEVANGVTTITKNTTCRSESYLMGCIFPYFKGKLKEIDQSYLNRFKTVVEKS